MKLFRRFLLVLASVAAVLAALAAVFYAVEDWRGARAWADCRRDLLARGERLDAAAFVPPPVPDDQNLAMAPLFVRAYGYRVDPATGRLTFPKSPADNAFLQEITSMPRGPARAEVEPLKSTGDWTNGHALDLAAWQQYYRLHPDFPHADPPRTPAEDVLLALTRYAPILDELAQAASARPLTRFPVNWTELNPTTIALPHYNALRCMTGALRLRATANLALGHDEPAARDLALAGRLAESTAADPVLIAQLVSVTQTGSMLQPVWEGLKARRWTRPELEQIKNGLHGLDYLAGHKATIRGERAMLCRMADYFKAHGGAVRTIRLMQNIQPGHDGEDRAHRLFGELTDLTPGGWYDQNKAIGCRFYQEDHIDAVDVPAHHIWLAKVRALPEVTSQIPMAPHTWLVKIIAPVLDSVLMKIVGCQADVDHAVIACALEQFYLDRQAYPARLDELVPGYLDRVPPDVIDGAPTRYRLTPDGRYALWSIGWNGRDDGGQVAWQKDTARRDNNAGDWVWQYQEFSQAPANIQRSK